MFRLRALSLAALASLLLAGCPQGSDKQPAKPPTGGDGGAAAPAEAPADDPLGPKDDAWKQAEQVFTFNNGAEPETLDPHLMTGVPESRLGEALFEGLVNHHPKTLAPIPGIAERWEMSDDGLVYTFHLRESAKWSDGTPITAQQVLHAWKRALTPATACQYGYQYYPVKNAEKFHKGELKDFAEVGVSAPDARTLKVTLGAPCPYFLDLVAFHTLFPVRADVIAKHGDQWSRPENIVCSGPYVLKEWLSNQRIVMEPNPHYWDRANVRLKKVVALPHQDSELAYKLFLQDECDWVTTVPSAKIDEVKRKADYYAYPYLGSYFYRINVTKKPFDDVRVRKAFSMGFDREIITRDILKAGQVPATWFTPAMPGYDPPKGLAYDREAARKLLAEAGFPGGKGFPTVELLYNTLDDHKKVAEAIVQQWEENLGITVSLRNTEWKVYLTDVEQLNYHVSRAGWIGDYTDPNTFLDMFVTGGGNNNTGWSNARYDELIAKAAKEQDSGKRMQLFREAETLLIEQELPVIPVYIYVNQGMLKEKVGGWWDNVRDLHPLKYIWIEPVE